MERNVSDDESAVGLRVHLAQESGDAIRYGDAGGGQDGSGLIDHAARDGTGALRHDDGGGE